MPFPLLLTTTAFNRSSIKAVCNRHLYADYDGPAIIFYLALNFKFKEL